MVWTLRTAVLNMRLGDLFYNSLNRSQNRFYTSFIELINIFSLVICFIPQFKSISDLNPLKVWKYESMGWNRLDYKDIGELGTAKDDLTNNHQRAFKDTRIVPELGTLEWINFNPDFLIRISTVETFHFCPNPLFFSLLGYQLIVFSNENISHWLPAFLWLAATVSQMIKY